MKLYAVSVAALHYGDQTAIGVQSAATPSGQVLLRERIRDALIVAGLSVPISSTPALGKLSPEQREEVARRLRTERPLSSLIMEDREDR
jgi:hypothetical protein